MTSSAGTAFNDARKINASKVVEQLPGFLRSYAVYVLIQA